MLCLYIMQIVTRDTTPRYPFGFDQMTWNGVQGGWLSKKNNLQRTEGPKMDESISTNLYCDLGSSHGVSFHYSLFATVVNHASRQATAECIESFQSLLFENGYTITFCKKVLHNTKSAIQQVLARTMVSHHTTPPLSPALYLLYQYCYLFQYWYLFIYYPLCKNIFSLHPLHELL